MITVTIATLFALAGMEVPHAETVTAEVTGYCPCKACCGPDARGVTASGAPARGRLVAAPRGYAFGTIIDVPGYGRAPVLDRGGAIKAAGERVRAVKIGKARVKPTTAQYDRLDLLFATHAEALRWGRKVVQVRVYSGVQRVK